MFCLQIRQQDSGLVIYSFAKFSLISVIFTNAHTAQLQMFNKSRWTAVTRRPDDANWLMLSRMQRPLPSGLPTFSSPARNDVSNGGHLPSWWDGGDPEASSAMVSEGGLTGYYQKDGKRARSVQENRLTSQLRLSQREKGKRLPVVVSK